MLSSQMVREGGIGFGRRCIARSKLKSLNTAVKNVSGFRGLNSNRLTVINLSCRNLLLDLAGDSADFLCRNGPVRLEIPAVVDPALHLRGSALSLRPETDKPQHGHEEMISENLRGVLIFIAAVLFSGVICITKRLSSDAFNPVWM